MTTATRTATPYEVRLRDDKALDLALVAAGIRFRSDLCRRMGVGRSTLERVTRRRERPGQRFIASLLAALPDAKFEDLFEVGPVTDVTP
jgi:hypothetical protein